MAMTGKIAFCAALAASLATVAGPETGEARDKFLKQQAYAEMQRVAGQVDVLESNQNALSDRVARLENGGGELAALKAEIEALRSEVNRLKAEMQTQRREIVNEIVRKIPPAPAPAAHTAPRAPSAAQQGPLEEYTVRPGDTLSLISQAFGTTVGKIKELNGLKGDGIRVGQRLMVPGQTSGARGR